MKKKGWLQCLSLRNCRNPLYPPLMPDIILSILFSNLYCLYFGAVTS